MNPLTAVNQSLPAFSSVRTGDWAALEAAIVRAGVPPAVAAEVVAFMPIAFGRVLLDGMGIEFSPEYSTPASAAEGRTAGMITEHPMYVAAYMTASGMFSRQAGGDSLVNTAVWSAEFSAVNQALHAGSNAADLVTGPPLIIGLDGAGPADSVDSGQAKNAADAKAGRPWWRVWG
ncbi:MAG TPA: hypothetical protein VLK84_15765 [Longimicrobium sp.]|nr:hypothetical protein [Longimicrobium sp.]